jgi:hypothetical protein
MAKSIERDHIIQNALNRSQIATLAELKTIGQTSSTMSIHRSLRRLDYLASYSHRGKFYTLHNIADFDTSGLWSCRNVFFSRYGNLLKTCVAFVDQSGNGFTSSELQTALQVEVNHALLCLVNKNRLVRKKMLGEYVYLCSEKGKRKQQELIRSETNMLHCIGAGYNIEAMPDELKTGIILFYSLLNEKQRRLYAGLEAAKLGRGGDRIIAEALNLDAHTVAKGRNELFCGAVNHSGIRKPGAGRKRVEKKRLK